MSSTARSTRPRSTHIEASAGIASRRVVEGAAHFLKLPRSRSAAAHDGALGSIGRDFPNCETRALEYTSVDGAILEVGRHVDAGAGAASGERREDARGQPRRVAAVC